MKIELRELNTDNIQQCFELRVSEEQVQYISSNEDSWKEAKENEQVARPFAIYADGQMVGFTMFAFDEEYEDPDDRYWLWRFMIDRNLQGKGDHSILSREWCQQYTLIHKRNESWCAVHV